jgi:ABC-type thiamine transport system substrate-binding protein
VRNVGFIDDFMEWMGSPEGQQSIEMDDTLWEALNNVQLDAKRRKLIWPDAKRLA